MSLNTLRLLQLLLLKQNINVGLPDEEIEAVLTAKRELAEAIAAAENP